MRNNIIVYPYSDTFYPLIHYVLEEYDSVVLVSPPSWKSTCYEDICGKVTFSKNVKKEIYACDGGTLLVVSCKENSLLQTDVASVISEAILKGFNIQCLMPLNEQTVYELSVKAKTNEVLFHYYCKEDVDDYTPDTEVALQKHNIPIIAVGNLLSEQETTPIISKVYSELLNRGYSTVVISGDWNLKFIHSVKLPDLLESNSLNAVEKVFFFNQFISTVELSRNPDVIVLDIPFGMMKYSDTLPNGFGILPYIMAQGVNIDYFILNTLLGIGDAGFFEAMSNGYRGRFGFSIDAVNVQEFVLDPMSEDEGIIHLFRTQPEYSSEFMKSVEESYIQEDAPQKSIYFCNAADTADTLVEYIIMKLSANTDTV